MQKNHEKTNRKGRKERKGIRVSESYCISPILEKEWLYPVKEKDFPSNLMPIQMNVGIWLL